MRFIVNNSLTKAVGDPVELNAVAEALSEGVTDSGKHALLTDTGLFLTGLIDVVKFHIETYYPRIEVEVDDKRKSPPGLDFESLDQDSIPIIFPDIELRDYQISAVQKLLLRGRGTCVIATGGGKTEIGMAVLKYLQANGYVDQTLFIVGSTPLLEQTQDRYEERGMECGLYGDDLCDIDCPNVVAMAQSLWSGIKRRNPAVLHLLNKSKAVVIDECHHLRSRSWINIASSSTAPWRFGLTMQSYDEIGEHGLSELRLIGATGPIVVDLPYWVLRDRGFLAHTHVYSIKTYIKDPINSFDWQPVYGAGVTDNLHRNSMFANLAHYFRTVMKRRPLIFVWRIPHGINLFNMLKGHGYDVLLYMGTGKAKLSVKGGNETTYGKHEKSGKYTYKMLKKFVADNRGIVIGSDVMTQGVDVPDIDALLIAVGMKKHRQLMQRIGRGTRLGERDDVIVIDPEDDFHPFLRKHSRQRREVYEHERIPISDGSHFVRASMENPVVTF